MQLTYTMQGHSSELIITAKSYGMGAELMHIEVLSEKGDRVPLPDDVIDLIGPILMAEVDWSEVYADQNEIIEEEN